MEPHLTGDKAFQDVPVSKETQPTVSPESRLFFETVHSDSPDKAFADLADKKIVPSKEMILHALDNNMTMVAIRALQTNPSLSKDDLLTIMQKAYSTKSHELIEACVHRGALPTERQIEEAVKNKEYKLFESVINALPESDPHYRAILDLAIKAGCDFKAGEKNSLARLAMEKGYIDTFFTMARAQIDRGDPLSGELWDHYPSSKESEFVGHLNTFVGSLRSLQRSKNELPPGANLQDLVDRANDEEKLAYSWEIGYIKGIMTVTQELSFIDFQQLFVKAKQIEPSMTIDSLFNPEEARRQKQSPQLVALLVRGDFTDHEEFRNILLSLIKNEPELFRIAALTPNGADFVVKYLLSDFLSWEGSKDCNMSHLMASVIDALPESDPQYGACFDLAVKADCDFKSGEKNSLASLALEKGYYDSFFTMARSQIDRGDPLQNLYSQKPSTNRAEFEDRLEQFAESLRSVQRAKNEVGPRASIDDYLILLTIVEKLAYAWEIGDSDWIIRNVQSRSLDGFLELFFKAKKIEPSMSLDALLSPTIDPHYLTHPVPEIKIPEALPETKIDTLLEMFDAAVKDGHITPRRLEDALKNIGEGKNESLEDLRAHLETYLTRVHNKTPFSGTPGLSDPPKPEQIQTLEAYYKKIENALRVIVEILQTEDDQRLKASLLLDLAVAGSYCGGRYFKEPKEVFNVLRFNPDAANISGYALSQAQRFRTNIVKAMAHALASKSSYVPHTEEYILAQLASTHGLPAPEFPDPYATRNALKSAYHLDEDGNEITELDICVLLADEFDVHHTSSSLISTFRADFNDATREQKDLLIDWFKEHVPDSYEKEFYDAIVVELRGKSHDEIPDFLLENAIMFSWAGADPQDAIKTAEKMIGTKLRGPLNRHIMTMSVEDRNALFTQYGITPPANYETAAAISGPLTQLVNKMRDEMLRPHQEALRTMVSENKTRDEIKAYLDGVKLSKTLWTQEKKKNATDENVLKEQEICTLGDYFPKEPPDPLKAVQNARVLSFVSQLYTKSGNFNSDAALFFLLHTPILFLPIDLSNKKAQEIRSEVEDLLANRELTFARSTLRIDFEDLRNKYPQLAFKSGSLIPQTQVELKEMIDKRKASLCQELLNDPALSSKINELRSFALKVNNETNPAKIEELMDEFDEKLANFKAYLPVEYVGGSLSHAHFGFSWCDTVHQALDDVQQHMNSVEELKTALQRAKGVISQYPEAITMRAFQRTKEMEDMINFYRDEVKAGDDPRFSAKFVKALLPSIILGMTEAAGEKYCKVKDDARMALDDLKLCDPSLGARFDSIYNEYENRAMPLSGEA